MNSWNIMQFKLEEILEKILVIENTTKEIQEFGDCLIANILICKEINEQKNEKLQKSLWDNIKDDLEQILNYSLKFLKEQNIKYKI